MYCPNCDKEFEGKFCPECGTKLIEKPAGGFNLNLGDANAISGGVNMSDSHNVHNEDRSVHNTSNVSNVTNNTTHNITQVAAQKTEIEILQERKKQYLNACNRVYEDNVLDPEEKNYLDRLRMELGLDEATANSILESVRIVAEKNGRKTTLNPLAKTKLKILSDNLQANNVDALKSQIDGLDVFVSKYAHDELSRKYYLVLAALKPEKCVSLHENNQEDSYWRSFWSYISYLKLGNVAKADEIIASMDKFADYPEDNITVLAVVGALINGHSAEANEYLSAVTGEYSPTLQRLVDSLYLLLDPAMAAELGATEETSAFYLENVFGQEDPKERARKEEEARIKVEQEAKAKAEAEARIKAEQEAKAKAEEEARIKAELEAKAKAEIKAKENALAGIVAVLETHGKAEQEAKAKAEEEARIKAEQEAKAKAEAEARIKAEQEAKAKAEEEARIKAEQEAKAKAEAEARIKAEQEAKAKAEEEARIKAEQEAKANAEEEARIKAEETAKLKAVEEVCITYGDKGYFDHSLIFGITLKKEFLQLRFCCVVPSDIDAISGSSFKESNVESIICEGNIRRIGIYAFYGCKSLENIEFKGNIREVEFQAFKGCDKLIFEVEDNINYYGKIALEVIGRGQQSIKLRDDTECLNSSLFAYTSITNISIPNGIKVIPSSCFNSCFNLKSVDLPKNLEEICVDSFKNAKRLKSIVIPETVKAIESGAFELCKELNEVHFKRKISKASDIKIDEKAFDLSKVTFYVPKESLEVYKKHPGLKGGFFTKVKFVGE